MAIVDIYKNRISWDILGYSEPILIENYKGLKLYIKKYNDEIDLALYLDGIRIMTTKKYEHDIILCSISQCPDDARVFVGGLGLGMLLLYIAESGKAKEVLIFEKDDRVMDLFAPRIEKYLRGHYPSFNFKIIKGDAYDEIIGNGLFDWIFIDISEGTPIEFHELSKRALTERGVYTPWEYLKEENG